MVYADFEYYTNTFLGNAIAVENFPRLALRASERIDAMTSGRAEAYFSHTPDPVAKATCAIAEIISQSERGNALTGADEVTPRVQTEITGKYHMTYFATLDTSSEAGQLAIEQAIVRAAWKYLARTGLLYAGVC